MQPLSARIDDVVLPGERLTRETFDHLRRLMQQRDDMVTRYRIATLAPIGGHAHQCIGSSGIEPDGWFLKNAAFRAQATQDLTTMTMRAILPSSLHGLELTIHIAGTVHEHLSLQSETELELPIAIPSGTTFTVEFESTVGIRPSDNRLSSDDRELALLPTSIHFS